MKSSLGIGMLLFSMQIVCSAALPPIVGTWQLGNAAANNSAVLVFMANGTYFHIQDGDNDADGPDGMERGTYTWNATSGALAVAVAVDTNGELGLSDPVGTFTVHVSGDTLTIADEEGSAPLQRVASASNPVVGGWQFGNGTPNGSGVAVFLTNGKYLFAQDDINEPEGPDGIEIGTYTWVEATGVFTGTPSRDTNGWLGFSDPEGPFSFRMSGDRGIFKDDEVTVAPERVCNAPGNATIQKAGANLSITFEGVLRETTTLGTWSDVNPQPTSPYTVVPTAGRRFFISRGH